MSKCRTFAFITDCNWPCLRRHDREDNYVFKYCYGLRKLLPDVSLLSLPSDSQERHITFCYGFLSLCFYFLFKGPPRFSLYPTLRNPQRVWQLWVPSMQWASQPTSKACHPKPMTVPEMLFKLFSVFLLPGDAKQLSTWQRSMEGRETLSGIKWETKGDKANMSFLAAHTSEKG